MAPSGFRSNLPLTKRSRPWFLLIFVVIGIGLLGGSVYLTHDTRQFVAAAAMASGEVIDLIESRDSDDETVYRPRVRYQTPDGSVREFTASVGSNPAGFYVGESVDVMYDPNQPSDARINTFFQLWFAPILLGGMGMVFTGMGVLAFRSGMSSEPESTVQPPIATPPAELARETQETPSASSPGNVDRGPVVDRVSRD